MFDVAAILSFTLVGNSSRCADYGMNAVVSSSASGRKSVDSHQDGRLRVLIHYEARWRLVT